MAQSLRFSFLTAGPALAVELPDSFDVIPHLSSPLTVHYGAGHRSYDFLPTGYDGVPNVPLIDSWADPEGRTVELYERAEEPRQWHLRWRLTNGALYTHLREEEGPERAKTYVAHLQIVERRGLPPFLLPEPPLGRGVLARPGYEESATFWAQEEGRGWVTLQRPGYVPRGKLMETSDDSHVSLRAGAIGEIEVSVRYRDEATAKLIMAMVMESLRPV